MMFVSSATSRRSVAFRCVALATTVFLGALSRAQDAVPTEKEQPAQPVPRPVLTDLDVSGTIVDGKFTVKQDDTTMVSLRFKKDGYTARSRKPTCSSICHCRPESAEAHLGSFLKPSWGSAFPGVLPRGRILPWGVSSPHGASSPCVTSQNRAALRSRSLPLQKT